MTMRPAQWFVRSFADGDTHAGSWLPRGGSVVSACGLSFVLMPVGWPAERRPLSGPPPDPDQICPSCYRSVLK